MKLTEPPRLPHSVDIDSMKAEADKLVNTIRNSTVKRPVLEDTVKSVLGYTAKLLG